MFAISEAEAAAIRAAFEQRGEFAAAVELRRLFPGITDNVQAREWARTIAGWKSLPLRLVKRLPKPPRVRTDAAGDATSATGRQRWRSPGPTLRSRHPAHGAGPATARDGGPSGTSHGDGGA